ncbi:MAG: hypothetical protein WBA46_06580 [Thermomicrobiales bacterium]
MTDHDAAKTSPVLAWSGPSPYCEIGRNHPRDRHRMKALDGYDLVWSCDRHSLFARLVDSETASSLKRNDEVTMHDDAPGIVTGIGDERGGGTLIYYRAQ